jgi:hypothetical protein
MDADMEKLIREHPSNPRKSASYSLPLQLQRRLPLQMHSSVSFDVNFYRDAPAPPPSVAALQQRS